MDDRTRQRLERTLRMSTLQMRYDVAGAQVLQSLRALYRLLFEYRYRPDQPRVPAGNPTGGQWTVDPNSARQREPTRVRVAADRDASFYSVDLEQEDLRRGGHEYRRHVGRMRADLIFTLTSSPPRMVVLPGGTTEYSFTGAEGSFRSAGEANFFVTRMLHDHPTEVERVVRGERIEIVQRFGYSTGIEAYRTAPFDQPRIRETYAVRVLLAHDPRRGGRGFRVVSAYPMNEVPNDVFRRQP